MTCDNLELLKILRNINFRPMLMNILRQKLQSPLKILSLGERYGKRTILIEEELVLIPIHKVAIYIVNLDPHKDISVFFSQLS